VTQPFGVKGLIVGPRAIRTGLADAAMRHMPIIGEYPDVVSPPRAFAPEGLNGKYPSSSSITRSRRICQSARKRDPLSASKKAPVFGGLFWEWWVGAGGAAERMELWVRGPPERALGESGADGPLTHSGGVR
jgi:hypothetical protein